MCYYRLPCKNGLQHAMLLFCERVAPPGAVPHSRRAKPRSGLAPTVGAAQDVSSELTSDGRVIICTGLAPWQAERLEAVLSGTAWMLQ